MLADSANSLTAAEGTEVLVHSELQVSFQGLVLPVPCQDLPCRKAMLRPRGLGLSGAGRALDQTPPCTEAINFYS